MEKEKEKKFNIGDIVQLKSGGPNMTVSQYIEDQFGRNFWGNVKCTWFVNNEPKTQQFDQDILEKV